MDKKTAIILSAIFIGVVALSAFSIKYNHDKIASYKPIEPIEPIEPKSQGEFSIPETNIRKEETLTELPAVYEENLQRAKEAWIKRRQEQAAKAASEETAPPPEAIKTTEPDGTIVETPNWAEQKQLAPDTDLTNPDQEPQYTQTNTTTKKPEANAPTDNNDKKPENNPPADNNDKKPEAIKTPEKTPNGGNASPKDGDTKVVNGETYSYWPPFGWVKAGSGNVQTVEHIELSGNHVGY